MTSQVDIYNLALGAAGTRNSINNPNETSREAETCNLFFPKVRDQILASAPWTCAKQFARLPVLAERDFSLDWTEKDPEPDFRFAYGLPDNLVRPRFITQFQRFTLATIKGDDNRTHRALMTDVENVVLTYTFQQTDINAWDPELQMGIVYLLAASIAMPLSARLQTAKINLDRANQIVWAARGDDANVDDNQIDTIPDWIAARGYAQSAPLTRYYFPQSPLLTIANVA